jgi:hypothetical protein
MWYWTALVKIVDIFKFILNLKTIAALVYIREVTSSLLGGGTDYPIL